MWMWRLRLEDGSLIWVSPSLETQYTCNPWTSIGNRRNNGEGFGRLIKGIIGNSIMHLWTPKENKQSS